MLTFNWVCCVIVSLFMGIPFLMDPMVLATLYVWCQLNKDVIVNFWFGTQFKVGTALGSRKGIWVVGIPSARRPRFGCRLEF